MSTADAERDPHLWPDPWPEWAESLAAAQAKWDAGEYRTGESEPPF